MLACVNRLGLLLKWRGLLPAAVRQMGKLRRSFWLAGELGFEPRQTESESVVLPLHHSP
jgi:hypothetical protein